MKKILLLLFCFITLLSWGQPLKREMRASWLATVYQLDWPKSTISQTGNQTEINTQKRLMTRMLDSLVSANMNAVCFQVRSRCDAMYKSSYEPWSSDLVATRGMDPGYDPLEFVIEEGHKRGLEVHAWVNPYRYESQAGSWTGMPGDYRTEKPDWVLTHNGAAILDPGKPEVQAHITAIIKEIVTNYDIDGVLFDDYFYLQGTTTQDQDTYAAHNPDNLSLADWRRSNVNKLISMVYHMIQEEKPYVTFGVSPAGIWDVSESIASSYGLKLPGGISGGYAYNGIYCDPVAWLNEGTVDYISPQIYWTIGSNGDYSILSPWWSDVALHFGKHFYSSHSISALTPSLASKAIDTNTVEAEVSSDNLGLSMLEQAILSQNNAVITRAFGPSEVGAQIQINRDADKNDAPGSIFYSTTKLYSTSGFVNYLKTEKFTHKVLPPSIHWKERVPTYVKDIVLDGSELTWGSEEVNVRYAVYAIPESMINTPNVFNTSEYYLGISYTTSFTIPENVDLDSVFAVAIVDRYGNEYSPVIQNMDSKIAEVPSLSYPGNEIEILYPFIFLWDEVSDAISYIIEVSEVENFSSIICAREVYTNSYSTSELMPLSKDKVYYWRVKAKVIGDESEYSSAWKFQPDPFAVISPADGTEDISVTPEIVWKNVGEEANYTVEIATSRTFSSNLIIYSQTSTVTHCQIPVETLVGFNTYYVRVKTQIDGINVVSDEHEFRTVLLIPEVVNVLSPVNNFETEENYIHVSWEKEPRAKGFRAELSTSLEFPSRGSQIKTIDPFVYEVNFTDLEAMDYYLRVRADYYGLNSGGSLSILYTDWSPVISIKYLNGTSIEESQLLIGNPVLIYNPDSMFELLFELQFSTQIDISLLSMSGETLKVFNSIQGIAGRNSQTFSLEDISSGVYLLAIKIDNEQHIIKVVK